MPNKIRKFIVDEEVVNSLLLLLTHYAPFGKVEAPFGKVVLHEDFSMYKGPPEKVNFGD